MGKKRKAVGRPYGESKSQKERDDSYMAINNYEDIADSEDEFLSNREKILLDEGPIAKRQRKHEEEDKFLQPSDEEVLDYSSGDDDDDDDIEDEDDLQYAGSSSTKRKHEAEEEEEDIGGWGPSKKDYYNADAIETEQDALDEEAEARRIQQKQLQAMTEADFGFDEDEWLDQKEGEMDASGDIVTEVLPQLQINNDMSEKEKVKILKTRYPEFEHISNEYLRLQPLHDELASAANAAERLIRNRNAKSRNKSHSIIPTPMAITKYRACAAYLAAMTMYFAILGSTAQKDGSSTIALDPSVLHEHGVMESLLKCQRLWTRVESLPVADPMVEASNGDDLSVIEEGSPASKAEAETGKKKKEKKSKKSKAQIAAEMAQLEADARRAEKLRETERDLADLNTLTDKSTLRKQKKSKKEQPLLNLLDAEDSDFGEETALTAQELAEKAKKKKSLRFYTSQIAQKANKRDAAGKDYGGDMDVPHRERLKDRQARLQAQAEKRGQNATTGPGVALGDGGESSDDNEDTKTGGGAFSEDDEYYDMVAARSKAKKEAKTDLATAMALAAKEGGRVVPEETIDESGRRQITYAIQKNRGLTARRAKVNRNPRVKKKLKYQDKMKKLKSQKRVYSGGEGRGGYGGELTGIKKGLVRSTKL
ncbi:Sas10 C-terminal domain-containing protein [Dendryphion nanum]|uniref:Sas10 C-terminal domain-containing protein n=1 Tax=Dendryphion nanum TaxID=256645 RepID=A0A9P9E464_9PLEO|nr:Sas10 C-terminal domain-containing protein [Dendryphion nanum]